MSSEPDVNTALPACGVRPLPALAAPRVPGAGPAGRGCFLAEAVTAPAGALRLVVSLIRKMRFLTSALPPLYNLPTPRGPKSEGGGGGPFSHCPACNPVPFPTRLLVIFLTLGTGLLHSVLHAHFKVLSFRSSDSLLPVTHWTFGGSWTLRKLAINE